MKAEGGTASTVSTLEEAAAWVDRVGLALVFPKDDLVLPSLWYAAGGSDRFSERDESGEFVRWVEPMGFVWGAKSELPGRGLCCGGKHLRGRASLIAHELVPALVAVCRGDPEDVGDVEREVLDVLASAGPTSARELPELLAHRERKTVRAALDRLQRRLRVTNAGLEEHDRWPANVVDLVDRRYADRLRSIPDPETARGILARRLLETVGELSAADLAAVFAWRKKESEVVLAGLAVDTREDHGTTVWVNAPAT